MALKKIKNVKLDVVRVNLTDNLKNPFLRAVDAFKPEEQPLLLNTTWDFLYILLLDEDPIAFFAPDTVVCPAKEFKKRISSKMDWIKLDKVNGVEEITLKFDARANEYANINYWVEQLTDKLHYNKAVAEIERFDTIINECFLSIFCSSSIPRFVKQ